MEKHTITADKLPLVKNIAGNYYLISYEFNNNCINVYI